ncbi:hypothetical protein [uncultured Clostridium sp.]|uniref:hypothetical protein n=1 Tax=uncultured Clostridium sp. TaxID=59620 RepID=UPI003217C3E7
MGYNNFLFILSMIMIILQIMYYINETVVDLSVKHYISAIISIIFILSDLILIFIWFPKSINKTIYISYIYTDSFLNKFLLALGLATMISWSLKLYNSIKEIDRINNEEE